MFAYAFEPHTPFYDISTSMKRLLFTELFRSKWFEPRCTSNSYATVIVRVKAILKVTDVSEHFELFFVYCRRDSSE